MNTRQLQLTLKEFKEKNPRGCWQYEEDHIVKQWISWLFNQYGYGMPERILTDIYISAISKYR